MLKLENIIPYKGPNYEDKNKPIKNELTDFINSNFLKYNENSLRLIKLIYKELNKVLNLYNLKLIFKGGNVMHLINNNIMKYFPPNSDKIIKEIFMPFLKKSDNDFTILLDPNIKNYNNIYYKLNFDILNALDKVRDNIIKNPQYYFDIYNLNIIQLSKLIKKLKIDLNNLNIINIKNIKLNSITDKLIMLKNKNNPKSDVLIYSMDSNKNVYYNSLNLSLAWRDFFGNLIKFGLLRTKINFLINDKLNVPGELIDVSIPHKNDFEMEELNSTKKFNEYMKKNIEKVYDQENDIKYYIINTHFIVKDLYKILFITNLFPWDDEKYEKRLARLIYFIFLDLLDNKPISIKSLETIKNFFKIYLKQLNEFNFYDTGYESADKISKKIIKYHLLDNFDKIKFDKFIENFKKYIKSVLSIIDEILKYMEGSTKIKNLYKINI